MGVDSMPKLNRASGDLGGSGLGDGAEIVGGAIVN